MDLSTSSRSDSDAGCGSGYLLNFHYRCAPEWFQACWHIDPFSLKLITCCLEQLPPFIILKCHKVLPHFDMCQDKKGKLSNSHFHYSNFYYEFLIWAKYFPEWIAWIYLKCNSWNRYYFHGLYFINEQHEMVRSINFWTKLPLLNPGSTRG